MAKTDITKQMLGKTLKELMETQPICDISVEQICKRCGVHRRTFYYHFDSKYALLNWVFDTSCILPLHHVTLHDFHAVMVHMVHCIDRDRNFYTNAFQACLGETFGTTVPESFPEHFIERMKPLVLRYRKPAFDSPKTVAPEEQITYYADTLAGSILGNLVQWLFEHPELTAEQYLELMFSTIRI